MCKLVVKKILSVVLLLAVSQSAWAKHDETSTVPVLTSQSNGSSTKPLVDKTDPYIMIQVVAKRTFARFLNEKEAIKADPNILKDIVREELMPYINYKYAAFKVLGTYLKNTTADEREEFVPVFREYLISSYAQVFTLYDNQAVEFFPKKSFENKKIVEVNTRVIMPQRENIDISFKVRKNIKTNEWKAFDMVAEGISLLDSKQKEFKSLIRQQGLPHVTKLLKEKSQRNIVFKKL